MSKELLIQSAVTLLATGRAKEAPEAVALAFELVGAVERAVLERAQKAKPRKPPPPLGARPRKVLERLGLVTGEAQVLPQELKGKVCEAHLHGAKGAGAATVKQISAWFKAHGELLPVECALYNANWLTNRCDEPPKEMRPFAPRPAGRPPRRPFT